jgi:putative PIN family toxin of toxin-antitoxin system
MPNVVIDASTVVSAALKPHSAPRRAVALARIHDVICISAAIEDEIREVLARPKFARFISAAQRDELLNLLLVGALRVEPGERVDDCRDEKDNRYLELAAAAGASFIVSGDRDLLDLEPWRGIRIITPAAYVALFAS